MRTSRRHYIDAEGVLRHRAKDKRNRNGAGRKVRSDYRTAQPHPLGCAHCAMVQAYRDEVERQREAAGGWRNEDFRPSFTFGDWLIMYYGQRRLERERDAAEALTWAA